MGYIILVMLRMIVYTKYMVMESICDVGIMIAN